MGLKIFSGQASQELAEGICRYLGVELGNKKFTRFADGEFKIKATESVRKSDVFIIQSTYYPQSEHLMELVQWIGALKGARVSSVTAVIPYFGWGRQDWKQESREPITARMVADQIVVAGADAVLTIDLHSPQIQGFFWPVPVDHLFARPVFTKVFKQRFDLKNFVVMGPDAGAAKMAQSYAKRLGQRPVALSYKSRPSDNVAEVVCVAGEVRGKDALLVDDMVDTGGTLIGLAEELKEMGAEEIYAFCTHGVLSNNAVERVEASPLTRLFITDTIPQRRQSNKIEVISVIPLLAEAIKRSYTGESVSPLFEDVPERVTQLV